MRSSLTPYRTPAERPAAPPAPERQIGPTIAKHGPTTPSRVHLALFLVVTVAMVVLATIGIAQISAGGAALFFVVFALAILVPAFGAPGFLVTVERSSDGLVVRRGWSRKQMFFEDVDEVWTDIEHANDDIATVYRVRLRDRDGREVRLPTSVTAGDELVQAVSRACTSPLAPLAREALRAGETLTFSHVAVSDSGVSVGGVGRVSWSDLDGHYLRPGRLGLRAKDNEWYVIDAGNVPHASLLFELIMGRTKRVDPPRSFLQRLLD